MVEVDLSKYGQNEKKHLEERKGLKDLTRAEMAKCDSRPMGVIILSAVT